MTYPVIFSAGQRLIIVIDDIIFFKRADFVDPRRRVTDHFIVIDDIIFLKMLEGSSIPLGAGGVVRNVNNVTLQVNEEPSATARGVMDPGKLIVIDPNECFIEINTEAMLIMRWADDNGIKRKWFERYDLNDLDYLTVVKDQSSGRLVFHLYRV